MVKVSHCLIKWKNISVNESPVKLELLTKITRKLSCQQSGLCGCKTVSILLQYEPDIVAVEPGNGLYLWKTTNIQIS